MFKRFIAWVKYWRETLSDPTNWDDSNDPCPYKCNCKDKKEKN
jgi:hypothetical protein